MKENLRQAGGFPWVSFVNGTDAQLVDQVMRSSAQIHTSPWSSSKIVLLDASSHLPDVSALPPLAHCCLCPLPFQPAAKTSLDFNGRGSGPIIDHLQPSWTRADAAKDGCSWPSPLLGSLAFGRGETLAGKAGEPRRV